MRCSVLTVKFGNGIVLTPGTHKGNPLPSLSGVVIVKKVLFVLNNYFCILHIYLNLNVNTIAAFAGANIRNDPFKP